MIAYAPPRRRPAVFIELLLLFGALFACAGSTTNNEPATPAEEEEGSGGTAGSAMGGSSGCGGDDCAGSEPESSGGGSSGSTAPDDPTPMYGSAGASAGCADNGDSCASDGAIVTAKTECGGNPPTQRPCYCAAALTYDCFLKHGCYAEAGASTSVTKAQLEIGRDGENNKAVALGAGCW